MRLILSSLVLSLGAFAADPDDAVPGHLLPDIHHAVASSNAVAVVTVLGNDELRAHLHVDQLVSGQLPDDIAVFVKSFAKGDLTIGNHLLVFFKVRKGAADPLPSGQYELIADGKIRDVPQAVYVTKVKSEAQKVSSRARPVASRARVAGPNS